MRSMRPMSARATARSTLRRALSGALVLTLCGTLGCSSTRTVTVQEEIQIGQAQRAQIKRQFKPVRDRAVVFFVRKLGESLVDSSRPSPFNISFDVIEDDSLNAFATFGGNIYVNTGTILAAESVDELAGVLSHEIGHVNGRHLAEAFPVNQRVNFVTRLLGFAVAVVSGRRAAQNTTAILSSIGATAYVTTFTRDAEREADALGVETLIKAGYDPTALATFFQRIKAEEKGGRGIPEFLRSHPVPDERIRNVQDLIAESDLSDRDPEQEVAINQDQFELIQNRIRLLTGNFEDAGADDEAESKTDGESKD